MRTSAFIFSVILFVILWSPFVFITPAQDSLYLIGTITGESSEHRIDYPVRIGDINGDGYDDFILWMKTGIPSHDQAVIKLYLGSADFDLNPDMIFHYPGSDSLNYLGGGYGIGDVNNDGYDDFILSAAFGGLNLTKGKVFLFYGGQNIDTIPVAEFYQTGPLYDEFGDPIVGLGDINCDGYNDFAVCSHYNWSDGKGYVYLFWGGDSISWENSLTLSSGTIGDFFGESVANIGDINDDGFDDIAVGASDELGFNDSAKTYIYYGGNDMDNSPDFILPGAGVSNFGDINGDGKREFVIINKNGGNIYYSIDSVFVLGSSFPVPVGSGDINNDGYDDFLGINSYYRNSDSVMVGAVYLYYGSSTIDTLSDYIIEGENQWSGIYPSPSLDLNGDGYDELLIFAPNYPDYNNPTGKLSIYSYAKPDKIYDSPAQRPVKFQLYQNFPNPFNPTTIIHWQLENEEYVTLKIYDILGNQIAALVEGVKSAGNYETFLDASKYHLSTGIYFCILNIKGGDSAAIKMVLVK